MVSAAAKTLAAVKSPRTVAGAAILALSAAIALVSWSRPDVRQSIGNAASHGIAGFNSVAAMIAARSPGDRPEGALASLKLKRQAAPHERALAKVRPAAPGTLAGIAGPAAMPPAVALPLSATPLFNALVPPPVIPAQTLIPGGPPGGFPAITPLPGGGGLIVPPIAPPAAPIPVTPGSPGTPATPVPEPSAWAMMLIGLVFIGRIVGRSRGAAANG
jgi:hypothetical protein